MAEKTKPKTEKKEEHRHIEAKREYNKEEKIEPKTEIKYETKTEEKKEIKSEEIEEKKEEKKTKKEAPKIKKKFVAYVNSRNLPISKKQAMYICSFIKGKTIDKAISDLEKVVKLRLPVPFKGEIPHRRGKGMMSGRYPKVASKHFINLLKGLKGNALVNQMDLDKTIISEGISNWAPEPARSGGRHAKRAHVTLKAKEILSKGGKK